MQPKGGLDVQPVIDWLIDAKPGRDPKEWLRLMCERMRQAGIRVDRVVIFVRPLHPNVVARAFYWLRDSPEVAEYEEGYGFLSTEAYLASPVPVVLATRRELRRRLLEPHTAMDFPVLHDLRKDGMTDYLVTPLEFLSGEVQVISFATRAAGGFGDAELNGIERIKPAMTRIMEIYALTRKASNILDAYLGRQAGEKVLQGRIQRGDMERIQAVIWFCDLRDSTPLAEAMGPGAFLAALNDYFECVLGPVLEREGEVLRFIGDAALAIFPLGDDPAGAAERAVHAARDALTRMHLLNERREKDGMAALGFGIGLHLGEVLYGNIGTRVRLEFTVVGAAANEAARIEALCKTLDVPLLVSREVASQVPADWKALGSHALRGVAKPIDLFTLS